MKWSHNPKSLIVDTYRQFYNPARLVMVVHGNDGQYSLKWTQISLLQFYPKMGSVFPTSISFPKMGANLIASQLHLISISINISTKYIPGFFPSYRLVAQTRHQCTHKQPHAFSHMFSILVTVYIHICIFQKFIITKSWECHRIVFKCNSKSLTVRHCTDY